MYKNESLHEKKHFRLTKICGKCRKERIFVCFRMFSFHGNIIFGELSLKRNVRKQHLSVTAYFCANIKFSYMIAGRKDEIFCRIVTKKGDFFASI